MTDSTDTSRRCWSIENRSEVYRGYYGIDRVTFRHTLHDGGMSETVDRELFVRGDVVGVLPYDPARDEILLVEQFRIGAMHRSDGPWLWEIVAGMIDSNESPAAVAHREAREEAGLSIETLRPIRRYLASPGASTEMVHLFLGLCNLESAGGRHGLAQEQEDIVARPFPAADVIRMLDQGVVCNALSVIALQWFARRRCEGMLEAMVQP